MQSGHHHWPVNSGFWNSPDVTVRGPITRAPSEHPLRTYREYFWNTRAAVAHRGFIDSPRARTFVGRCRAIQVANAADGNRWSIQ